MASRTTGTTLLLFLLLAAPSMAAESVPRDTLPGKLPLADSLEHWYALGIDAHHLCAGLWVVGRDLERTPEEVVSQDIAPFPSFHWHEEYEWSVDEEAREATVSVPGIGARTAEYNGDQGCTILPAGSEDVYYEPTSVSSALPPASEQEWPTGDRDARGTYPEVDREAIEATLDWAFDDSGLDPDQNTRGVVVLYRGKILAERYAPGWGPHTPQISWSMGKSIASALTGVMVERGYYGLDDPAPVDAWRGPGDPRREIRIRNLLRMSSGLDFDNFGLDPAESYTAANEHMRIYFDALNVRRHAIHQPLRFEPGSTWRYRNSDPLSLMHVARTALAREGRSWLRFPREALFDRIGMRTAVLETDAWGNFILTGFDYASTRDWARFGLLHLNDGVWEGERILPEGWAEFVSTPAPGAPEEVYGGLFWLNRSGALDRIPRDAYFAAGYMGQYTVIIPSREMVVVRQGPSAGDADRYLNELVGRILDAVGRPVAQDAP
jgi:CubicO group peptidase (beta-lactamase class C family)